MKGKVIDMEVDFGLKEGNGKERNVKRREREGKIEDMTEEELEKKKRKQRRGR